MNTNIKKYQTTALVWLIELFLLSNKANSFRCSCVSDLRPRSLYQTQGDPDAIASSLGISKVASKFKVVTCMSTSCSKKRNNLGLDPLSTFGAFYSRSKGNGDEPTITVDEGPCLGACKMAPCVAVEHEDFVGSVSLEGMTEREFSDRVFHNIITEEDADRVWSSITNAIQVMAAEEEEDQI